MKKLTTLCICVFLFLACNKNKGEEKVINDILYSDGEKEDQVTSYNSSNYETQFNQLIGKYDTKMRVSIAKQIDNQLIIYQQFLTDLSKAKKTSISNEEFQDKLIEIQSNMLTSLFDSEIDVNADYYEFILNLNALTDKYILESNLDPSNFENFENLDRIELNKGVVQKINELALDEEAKSKPDIIKNTSEYLSFLAYVPFPPMRAIGIGMTLFSFSYEALNDGVKQQVAGYTAQMDKNELIAELKKNLPESYYDKKTNSFTVNALTSENKKYVTDKYNNLNTEYNLDLESDFKKYHVVENEIKGRVGDYSDGIWTVHYQNLLKIKDNNLKKLKSKEEIKPVKL